ncbi:MAG: glutathione S-transferase family protein [Halioglobus sp.]
MITLYGASLSPFVRKVRVVLALKNLQYEYVQSMPWSNDEELAKVSPLGKIPAMRDGELKISDSKVLSRYLENAYPEIPVYPTDAAQKARADWYEEYAGSVLSESAAGLFFHRVMRPMMMKQPVDEERVSELLNDNMPKLLKYLEGELPEQGFLFGDLGAADISIASPFVNAGYASFAIDAKTWPITGAFMERVKSHALVAAILDEESQTLASMQNAS